MEKITIRKVNEVHIRLECSDGVAHELSDHFTFYVPNAHFSPKFKKKQWDGKIRLFHRGTRQIYYGLYHRVKEFAVSNGYEIEVLDNIDTANEFSVHEAYEYVKGLDLPSYIDIQDYQLKGFIKSIRDRRILLESPTSSGKSLMIYLITRYLNCNTLIIVDTKSLTLQMLGDFKDYAQNNDDWNTYESCHTILEGAEKHTDKPITIATWQSIQKEGPELLGKFQLVIGDEAHHFKAMSLKNIMENTLNAEYKIGTTGTVQDEKSNRLVLEGVFGPIKKLIHTHELIDRERISDIKINAVMLRYGTEICKAVRKMTYKDEIDFLVHHPKRNLFIRNLTISLKNDQNTLLLFRYVDHGKALYESIKKEVGDRHVYFVYGQVNARTREKIRAETEKNAGVIIVASYGTYSTGINIKRLHNIIVAHPTKSKIQLLQAIGRILRKSEHKQIAIFYDIVDDLTAGVRKNYVLKHFMERLKIYIQEKFDYKVYKINVK